MACCCRRCARTWAGATRWPAAMNTANAAGYLLGALMTPALMRRFGPVRLLVWRRGVGEPLHGGQRLLHFGACAAAAALAGGTGERMGVRRGRVAGGAAGRLQPSRAGFLLGLYYGGTGFGITLSALLVPPVLQAAAGAAHGWAWAWWALALASFAAHGGAGVWRRARCPARRGAPAGGCVGRRRGGARLRACVASAGRWRATRSSAPATSAT